MEVKSYIHGVKLVGSDDQGPANAVACDMAARVPVYVLYVRRGGSCVLEQVTVLSKFRFGNSVGCFFGRRSPRGGVAPDQISAFPFG